MQQIGKSQLALLIILFLVGSTPLFELGIKAKQDAWLTAPLCEFQIDKTRASGPHARNQGDTA